MERRARQQDSGQEVTGEGEGDGESGGGGGVD
jgi:hypothetical protein